MRFLLRLKHWQLFLITWGLGFVTNVFSFTNIELMVKLFPIATLAFAFGTFGWVWAIAVGLHHLLPRNVKLDVNLFRAYFAVPIVYIVAIMLFVAYQVYFDWNGIKLKEGGVVGVVLFLHVLSMAFIFLGVGFAAKTMKSVELGRLARFGDYAGEFFLIWFSIIGYWVLQPRLNRLVDDRRNAAEKI